MESLIIGNTLIKLDAVDSTNRYAMELIKDQTPREGLIIWTLEQTAGRGQRETKWHSTPGKNLTCSVILTPGNLSASRQFLLSRIAALAVYEALEAYLPGKARIKWPNDILFEGRKIAGILLENLLKGDKVYCSVLGLGLNVNQENFQDLPEAISLYQATGRSFEIEELLNAFCTRLNKWYLRLQQGQYATIREAYLEKLWGWQTFRSYETIEGPVMGKITGVTEAGKLEVTNDKGEVKTYDLKEIRLMPLH